MAALIELAAALVVLPIAGGFTLAMANVLWVTATASSTPKWQQYLWFLVTGYVLLAVVGLRWP